MRRSGWVKLRPSMTPCAGSSSTIIPSTCARKASRLRSRRPARPVWRAICACLGHAVFAQRMGACPFGRRAVPVALDPRLERRGAGQLGKHRRAAVGIIAGRRDVADAEHVGLIFLVAREAQQPHLGKLLRALRNQAAERIAADHGAQNLAEHAQDRAVGRCRTAGLGVIGGDVAGFMARRRTPARTRRS